MWRNTGGRATRLEARGTDLAHFQERDIRPSNSTTIAALRAPLTADRARSARHCQACGEDPAGLGVIRCDVRVVRHRADALDLAGVAASAVPSSYASTS